MAGVNTYRGVFGEWGWEFVDDDGAVTHESQLGFETLDECVEDVRRRGWNMREKEETASC